MLGVTKTRKSQATLERELADALMRETRRERNYEQLKSYLAEVIQERDALREIIKVKDAIIEVLK